MCQKTMPAACEICQSTKAVHINKRDIKCSANNTCYEPYTLNGEIVPHKYKPFANSNKVIDFTCKGFCHLRCKTEISYK